jgi:site-specific recombinase XerC
VGQSFGTPTASGFSQGSRLMGHAKLSTTMEYLKLSMSTVFRQYNAAHPHGKN